MEFTFSVNSQLDIPIYRQLMDAIRAEVKKGNLPSDTQLPTVQELSETLGVARGTVKRVYDELEREGLVEKVQGRGTFVSYHPLSTSKREQAMSAIDALLSQLEAMGFTTTEINIFLNLKLRERSEQESHLKVALVECNSENLASMSEQLRHIENIDLYCHLFDSVEQYPYKLDESFDLIVTTLEHAPFLEQVLPAQKRLVRVALRLKPACMAEIIKLNPGSRVGVMCYSKQFGQLLYRTCIEYADAIRLEKPVAFSEIENMSSYLRTLDAVLVPEYYEKYCSREDAALLECFSGKCIACTYEMDDGSFVYLREKSHRILKERTI